MAPGYVIAAFLETSGLIGLLLAAVVLRAERQAKAAELRCFLRSGQSALAAPVPVAPSRRVVPAPRMVDVPVELIQRGTVPERDSAARAALRRALARGVNGRAAGLDGAISAG